MSVVFLIFIQLCRGGFCRGQSGPEYFFYKRVIVFLKNYI